MLLLMQLIHFLKETKLLINIKRKINYNGEEKLKTQKIN